MDYIRITDANDSLLDTILLLYEQSFPEKERRDFSQLRDLLAEDRMQLVAITDDFINYRFFYSMGIRKVQLYRNISQSTLCKEEKTMVLLL
jgi:hypothetical protein